MHASCFGLEWANEGAFSGVDAEMVVEVVEFTEKPLTTGEIAFQNSQGSLCARVCVFEDSKLPRVWF